MHRDQQGKRKQELLRFEGPASRGAFDDRHGDPGDRGGDQECDRQRCGQETDVDQQRQSNPTGRGLAARTARNEPSGGRRVIKDRARTSGMPTANPVPADSRPEKTTASTSGISIAYKTSNPGPKAIAPRASNRGRGVVQAPWDPSVNAGRPIASRSEVPGDCRSTFGPVHQDSTTRLPARQAPPRPRARRYVEGCAVGTSDHAGPATCSPRGRRCLIHDRRIFRSDH